MKDSFDLKRLGKYSKVAVMGGTFDPLHFGHLLAAQTAADMLGIQKVLFIPLGCPPHKDAALLTDARRRLEMSVRAVRGNKLFGVSAVEIERPGTTYSIDTAREIKRHMRPDAQLFFIIGADTASHVQAWKDSGELMSIVRFAVARRRGFDAGETGIKGAEIIEMPLLEISSSAIRDRVSNRVSIKYLLPDSCVKYIYANGLYFNYDRAADEITAYVKEALTPKRLAHTMGVLDEALRLARIYGADEKKIAVAALLHDCAKDIPHKEKFAACKKYGIKIDKHIKANPDLAHPLIGAKIAENVFGVTERDVLNSVKFHTTGRKAMSLTEKIIFIADLTEPGRKYSKDLEIINAIRETSSCDIDKALVLSFKRKIGYTQSCGFKAHPLSQEALSYLIVKE